MQTTKMPVQAGGVQINTRALVVLTVITVIVVYLIYSMYFRPSGHDQKSGPSGSLTVFNTWKTMDPVDIPSNIKENAAKIKIKERLLTFEYEDKKGDIFVRELADERRVTQKDPILLLHGAAFTSQNWLDLGTLGHLAAIGHKVVAIDLPGWGKSKSFGTLQDKGGFLAKFIHQEKLNRPVIISPSMSGSFSIPYLMGDKPWECTDRVRGFVPVAPVGTEEYTHAQWHRCETPTMIVYGSKDTQLGLLSLNNMRNMPNMEFFSIKDAKHPAYLDDPEQWHRLLYNFLLAVEREAA